MREAEDMTRDEKIIKETKWKKYNEKDAKAIFSVGEGWLRIDYVIEGKMLHQELIMDVYLDKAGNLEFT